MSSQRIEWIDVAKGIGIILVIAGHSFYLQSVQMIYAFHMPLFFFLSGLLLPPQATNNLKEFVVYKSKHILGSWGKMLLISTLICIIIPSWRIGISFKGIVCDIYTANTNFCQNSSLWYLPCFFFVLLMCTIANKMAKKTAILCIILISLISLFLREILVLFSLPGNRLPLKIDTALVVLPFVFFASVYREKIFMFFKRTHIILFFIINILFVVLGYINGWSNTNSLEFGNVRYLFYPVAFLGIASICLFSVLILRWKTVKQIFVFYGRNSLVIFAFQSLFIRMYLLFFNKVWGFNMSLYGDNPIWHQWGAFLLVTLILSPITVWGMNELHKHNINIL